MTKDDAKEVQESVLRLRQAEGALILFADVETLEKYLFMLQSHRAVIKRVTQAHVADQESSD